MITPTFEDDVTKGQAQWPTSVDFDPVMKGLVVGLTHDPERAGTQRVLHCAEAQSVRNRWVDQDDDCTESLLGAYEQKIHSGFRYMLVTEQREIEFEAGKKARINDVGSNNDV